MLDRMDLPARGTRHEPAAGTPLLFGAAVLAALPAARAAGRRLADNRSAVT
ncbi:hypothetical protein ACIBW9_38830 [Streptomyces sp. NPDC049541]|uniref:hypothetical protein n=1 Tax=Streptomyces sp. NPDC049541 TaxID=3365594 RepID=UPI00378D8DC0